MQVSEAFFKHSVCGLLSRRHKTYLTAIVDNQP